MEAKGLIYLPDISGFSKFVNEIDIEHGEEIISELIENIIASDRLDLDISEIEGDAILYYRFGDDITPDLLLKQSEITFNNFHTKIVKLQSTRICECNACSSIKNLSLKFIAHFGEMKILKIGNFNKLYGKGLIVAHRLLKNQLNEKEYVLFTKDYCAKTPAEAIKSLAFTPVKLNVEIFGIVDCYFIKLELPNRRGIDYATT